MISGQTKTIPDIARLIEPAIKKIQKGHPNSLDRAVQANVNHVASELRKTAFLAPLLSQNQVDVVGGVYHLETGKVGLFTLTPKLDKKLC